MSSLSSTFATKAEVAGVEAAGLSAAGVGGGAVAMATGNSSWSWKTPGGVNPNHVNTDPAIWLLGSPSYPGGGNVPTYGASTVRVTHLFANRIPASPGEKITFSVGNASYRAAFHVINNLYANIYDSGWVTTAAAVTYTIPANAIGICIVLSHADNSALSAREITQAKVKLEFASAATTFSRHPADVAATVGRRPDTSPILQPAKFRFIAHRGGYTVSPTLPENSLAAFARAAATPGVWAVETDVRETSDGRFVLMHDATVDRTTNGTGTISAMTYAEVRACTLDGSSEPVPNLTEYLLACKKYGAIPVIEIKAITNYQAFVDEIVTVGMEESAVVIYDGWTPLEAIRAISDRIHLMRLGSFNSGSISYAAGLGRCGINAADIPGDLTTANIKLAHSLGVWCIVQVINSSSRVTELFNLGTDGVTSDSITAVP